MQKKIVTSDFLEKSILSDIKLRWLIVLIGGAFFIGYVFFVHIKFLPLTLIIVILSVLFNLIINFYFRYFLNHPIFYSYLTGFFDISVASVAIFFTGGINSPLYLLYYIIILDACFEFWAKKIFLHLTAYAAISFIFIYLLSAKAFWQPDILAVSIKIFFLFFACITFYFISRTFSEQYEKLLELSKEKEKLYNELVETNKNLEIKIKNAVGKLEKSNIMLIKKNITLLAAHEIYKSANEIRTKGELLDVVLNTLIPLMKGSGGLVLSINREKNFARVENFKQVSAFYDVKAGEEFKISSQDKLFEITNTKKAIICENLNEINDYFFHNFLKEGSYIATPLIQRNKVKHLIIIFNKNPNAYSRADIELMELLGEQIGILLYSRELYDELRKRANELEKIIDVTLKTETSLKENEIINIALTESIKNIYLDSSGVVILQDNSNILKIKAQSGFSDEILGKVIDRESICGWVCKNNKNINIRNIEEIDIYNKDYDYLYIKKYAIGAPIHIKNNVIGAIFISRDTSHFDKEDVYSLNILSNYMGSALESAKLYENIKKDYLNTIYALAAAVDAKDHYTHGHSTTVMKYSVKIAQAIGLPEDKVETIKYAALLHDIGKIGISENIINKPSKLTKEEYAIMKMHPQLGANIVSKIDALKDLIPLILSHHEWINGAGYPLGLRGDEIPLGAKIISIADAYSTMTSKRPYREIMGTEYALKELKKYAGIQFDAELVDVFVKIIEKEQEQEKEQEKTKEKKRIRIKMDENVKNELNKDEKFYS